VTQFTYIQQAGGFDLKPVSAELTYGLERVAMYLQNVDNVYDLRWVGDLQYGDVHHQSEVEYSRFNFEQAGKELNFRLFDDYERECQRLLDAKESLVLPAYDYCLKCSHTFNLLDARGAISVAERQRFIGRVRGLAKRCAERYLAERERLGFPLLKGRGQRAHAAGAAHA
jgi:glycyl-tRNA synthetase alpha chain